MTLILWKFLKATFFTLIAFFSCVILFVVVLNAKDQLPSEIAIQFRQLWDDKVFIDPLDNGYLYLLGFDAEKNSEPREVGRERVQWLNEVANSQSEEFFSFPNTSDDFRRGVPVVIQELVDTCFQVSNDCVDSINSQREIVNQWSQQEAWILERYRKLIEHTAWFDVAVPDMRLPIPNYADVMKAQRLTFIKEFAAISNNDKEVVVKLLNTDLSFWRVMLQKTDTLIGKMIAVAAIKNNLMWTNRFSLNFKSMTKSNFNLIVLDKLFTNEELSMRSCLIGEWVFFSSYTSSLDISSMDGIGGKIIINLFYKKQDTLNIIAGNISALLSELDVPLADFENRLRDYQKKESIKITLVDYLRHPYNMVGRYLSTTSPASLYTEYVVRTKDLEAFRRGLLLSIEMMGDVSKSHSVYVSPYKTKPFVFNQERRSLTVMGLGEGERATQTYFY